MKVINLIYIVVISLVFIVLVGCEKSLEPLGTVESSDDIALVSTVLFEELQQQHDSIVTLNSMLTDGENVKNRVVISQVIETQKALLAVNAETYLTEQYQYVERVESNFDAVTASGVDASNAQVKVTQAHEQYTLEIVRVEELLSDLSIEISPILLDLVGVSSAIEIAGMSSVGVNQLSSQNSLNDGTPAPMSSQAALSSQQTIELGAASPQAPAFTGKVAIGGVLQENTLVELVHGVCIDIDNSITPALTYAWYVETSNVVSGNAPVVSSEKYYTIPTQDVGNYVYGVVICVDGDGIQIADTTALSLVISLTQASSESNSVLSSSIAMSSSSESVSSASKKYFNSTSKTLDLESDDDENVQLPQIAGDWQGYGITLEAWVKWESIEKDAPIISITNGAYNYMILLGIEESNNGLKYTLDNGTPGNDDWAGYNHANYFSIGVWTHVAIAIDGDGSMSMYKNGVAVVSNITVVLPVNQGRYVNAIGKGPIGADGQFDGKIDNVRIWNIKRTAAQIADNMYNDCDNLTSSMGLVAGYDFNKESGAWRAMDNSGNGNDGSLNNMTGTDTEDWLPQVDFGSL